MFPLKSQWLDWNYQKTDEAFHVVIPSGYPEEFKLLFWSVFEKACALSQVSAETFRGRLEMRAQIQVGSGLGASATLCVALTRWFLSRGHIQNSEAFIFSKKLEDVFHGESSGVDVAVVLKEKGLIFKREQEPQTFSAEHQPLWYLSHCGEKGITKECVNKVKSLGLKNPQLLQATDEQMKKSVELCQKALLQPESSVSTPLLKQALDLGLGCFKTWDLVTAQLDRHMQELILQGALAVKPTGSGGGGFVLSLWSQPPPENFKIEKKMLKASVF